MKTFHRLLVPAFAACSLFAGAAAASAKTDPVLMVIANQDFYYREYGDTRASLESQGLDVVVAATTTEVARPHANRGSGQGADGGFVRPDLALADVEAEDYSGIVFVGGWGSSMYQYDFPGDYDDPAYGPDRLAAAEANRVIKGFLVENKPVAAICHGVSVLAWARVDGASPIEGKTVAAWAGSLPSFRLDDQEYAAGTVPLRLYVEANGATMPLSGAIGDPQTTEDDVIVDGNIITAESHDSAALFGRTIARAVRTASRNGNRR